MKNETYIVVLLDRSGSMSSNRQGTVDGMKEFIKGQQKTDSLSRLKLVQFDHEYGPVETIDNIDNYKLYNLDLYAPRGTTALLDALGRTIVDVGNELSRLPEDERSDKVLFVIMTDGLENASKDYTREKILEMIKHQTDVYKWQFIYLGANQDAIKVGSQLGIGAGNTMTYNNSAGNTQLVAQSLGAITTSFRATGSLTSFSDEDRKKAVDGGK